MTPLLDLLQDRWTGLYTGRSGNTVPDMRVNPIVSSENLAASSESGTLYNTLSHHKDCTKSLATRLVCPVAFGFWPDTSSGLEEHKGSPSIVSPLSYCYNDRILARSPRDQSPLVSLGMNRP